MDRRVTILMYHFVRDLARSRFPRLKALDVAAFREQLAYIRRHYTVVTVQDVIAAAQGETLPPSACLLTFDDGYADHFSYVFPLLDEYGWQGAFFPAVAAVAEDRVLDVNKIQFALAAADTPSEIAALVKNRLDAERPRYGLEPTEALFKKYSGMSRYDTPETTFVKRVLQRGLPEPLRSQLVDEVFHRFVSADEKAFARELYVSSEQLRTMVRHGMVVGGHGRLHVWLDALQPADQRQEVADSLVFLKQLGVPPEQWVMCYPYGGYNESLLTVTRDSGYRLGLTVDVAIADLRTNDRFALPRLDTNDLPSDREAPAAEWTRRASAA
jgi:peptidoglycan/xylan/chitin deacetylase (PgdA/CDA1 family)